MATRADRLNERLRGAQHVHPDHTHATYRTANPRPRRVNVDDDDTFNLDLPQLGVASTVTEQPPAPAARRADRLNERLRGAQHVHPAHTQLIAQLTPRPRRVNVDDDDTFNLDLPQPDAAPTVAEEPPEQAARSSPGSRPRRPVGRPRSSSSVTSQGASSGRKSIRNRPGTASSLPNVPEEGSPGFPTAASTRSRRNTSAAATSSPTVLAIQQPSLSGDELEDIPVPTNKSGGPQPRSRRGTSYEEVEASPADAPGSGRRVRRLPSGPASELSVRLHNALEGFEEPAASSSPSARVAKRKSDATGLPSRPPRASTRRSSLRQESRPDVEDELSPGRGNDADQDMEPAGETSPAGAVKTTGRKRPRKSASASRQSPNPGSGSPQAVEESPPKRRRGRPSKSPVVQKQPRTKAAAAKARPSQRAGQEAAKRATKSKPSTTSAKEAPKRKRKSNAAEGNDEVSEAADDDNAAIEITVQRFVNLKKRAGGNDDEEDPLHSEIPFANRTGESTVDVFAQVCEEVINNTMGQFHELLSGSAADAAKKKEFRIKMRAIEAYKEELNSRLLQHTIHLDHWYTLKKRVRHVQKEKLTLREEILKLKAEREQVALRMDAIRIKHEADTKESTYRLDASALMHDIDLAVERGQKAPELTRKEQKEADLANLELLIAQVTDQASSKSATGGLLSQVTDFNAFLERAALALESR